MPGNSPIFACGEFKPGRRKIDPGSEPPIILPPIYIPKRPKDPKDPKIPPVPGDPFPPPPRDPGWVCICNEPCEDDPGACTANRRCLPADTIGPPGSNKGTTVYQTKQECEQRAFGVGPCWLCSWKCEELDPLPCPDGETTRVIVRQCSKCQNAAVRPPGCDFGSLFECQLNCMNEVFPCVSGEPPVDPPGPPGGGGGGGGTTPGPSTPATPGGPRTGGGGTFWGCVEVRRELCPNGVEIERIFKDCRSSRTRGGVFIHPTQQICEQTCFDDIFTCRGDPPDSSRTLDPPNRGGGPPITGGDGVLVDPGDPPGFDLISRPEGSFNTPDDRTNNSTNRNRISVEELAVGLLNSPQTSNQTVYDAKFNLFNYPRTLTSEEFVSNSKYLNLFKDQILREVHYVLNTSESRGVWREYPYSQLSLDKIAKCLRPEFLEAIRKLKTFTGQDLKADEIISAIAKLLIEGRLDEFDPNYYMEISRKQERGELVEIVPSNSGELNRKAALGLIASEGISLNPDNYDKLEERTVLRGIKPLVEDLNGSIEIESADPFPIESPGIPVEGEFIPLGDGDAYYVLVNESEGVPVRTDKNFAVLPDESTKDKSNSILGVNSDLRIQVSAVSGQTEFDANFSAQTPVSAMFFKLNFSSISGEAGRDPITQVTTTKYDLVTELSAINQFNKTYGLHVVDVNVDYRDPILYYFRDSETLDLQSTQVTFNNFASNKNNKFSVIPRNIPFGLVINPVNSIQDNPLAGASRLESFQEPYVRSLFITPHFAPTKRTALESTLMFDETGQFSFGVSGYADTQNVFFLFDTSNYTNSFTLDEFPFTYTIKQQIITDVLENRFTFSFLTWWDLFRRFSSQDFGKAFMNLPEAFFQNISSGGLGYPVRFVLDREGESNTGLTLSNSSVEDRIFLNEEDRENLFEF